MERAGTTAHWAVLNIFIQFPYSVERQNYIIPANFAVFIMHEYL